MIAIRFRSLGARPSASIASSTRRRVALEERVDERQLAARVDQEGVHATARLVAERVHARRELDHARRQGANGFATPSSAGSSAGKWRRSNDRIDVLSTQSMPARV